MKRFRASSHEVQRFLSTLEYVCFCLTCFLFILAFSNAPRSIESPDIPPQQTVTAAANVDRMEVLALMKDAEGLRADWLEASFRGAIARYGEVVRLSWARSDFDLAAKAASSAGEIHFILSEYQNALRRYEEARSLRRQSRNRSEEMRALGRVALVNVSLGKASQALPICMEVIDYFRDLRPISDPALRAEAQNCAGEANYSLSKHKQSIVYFEQAQTLWREANDANGQALASLNLGYAYSDLGDPEKAKTAFDHSLALYRETKNRRGEALALTGLGSIYSLAGNKQAALDHHSKASEILKIVGDHAGEAIALNSTGQVYEDLNNPDTAIDHYSRAFAIYDQLGNTEFAAVTKFYIGRTYNLSGKKEKAVKFFSECVSESEAIKNDRLTAYALTKLSGIRRTDGLIAEAQLQLKTALRLFRKLSDRIGQGNALIELGHTYRDLGNHREAFRVYSSAVQLFEAAGDHANEAESLYYSAFSQNALGHVDEALARIKRSNEVVESLRAQIISPELRSSYFASVHKHAELYIDLLIKSNNSVAEAFEVSEKTHSRSLLEVLGEASAQIRKGANPELLEQEHSLQQKLRAKALYRMRLLDASRDPKELAQLETDIREITTAYNALQTKIKQQSQEFGNLVQPQPLNLREVQANLESDTLLLEYLLGVERSYLWAVTQTSINVFELPGRNVLEASVEQVGNLLKARASNGEDNSVPYEQRVVEADAKYWPEAAKLSTTLLGPVAALKAQKRLVIVPDGALHFLPFEALPEPLVQQSSSEPEPLVLAHEVVSLPSASILAQLRRPRSAGEQQTKLISVLADPVFSRRDSRVDESARQQASLEAAADNDPMRLEATRREADAIMNLTVADEGTKLLGFEANRRMALSGNLGQYRIVHFATHATVDIKNPELSGIILSLVTREGDTDEGFLQLPEIYNLNLDHTQLVVLSACETGFGNDVRGEGLVSLSRGFIYAGSRSVVGSLWKVDDTATSQLMTKFYEGMFKERLTPSAALRQAKEFMWRSSQYRAPFYWAAFVLQGEYRDRIEMPPPRHYSPWLLVASAPILAIGVYLLIRVRRRRSSSS
jgi:CHAT domain-containing protein/tetratricopeptide (TPR) repeat protein